LGINEVASTVQLMNALIKLFADLNNGNDRSMDTAALHRILAQLTDKESRSWPDDSSERRSCKWVIVCQVLYCLFYYLFS
jgi:hypothetical protein